eukprot:TRINITY_DN23536_c0_g1_i1.p1 TRINITY_DN23536_c0_g1~~TRINITY_DN23536_c0_g1_i1.p1  ORF type:complete len:817 (+),score=181.67 TRINITY_DN23536_c0_g1_i1:69-2453(+)
MAAAAGLPDANHAASRASDCCESDGGEAAASQARLEVDEVATPFRKSGAARGCGVPRRGGACLSLLEAVEQQDGGAAVPVGAALWKLLKGLRGDRLGLVACRHQGVLKIVSDAWRAAMTSETAGEAAKDVAAAAASVLLLYASLHSDNLKRLGVGDICADTLTRFGGRADLAAVARLWRKVGGVQQAAVFTLLSSSAAGCSSTLRPLLNALCTQRDLSDFKQCGGQAALEDLLPPGGNLADTAMRLLCRLTEPLPLPACQRGCAGEESGESESEASGGEGEEEDVKRSRGGKAPGDKKAAACWESDVDARSAGISNCLSQSYPEVAAASAVGSRGLPEEGCRKEVASPYSPTSEFKAHLGVDATAAKAWPVLYPVEAPGPCNAGLLFESNFEGGNLRRVRRQGDDGTLELLLHGDTNRSAHSQWFFFDVEVEADVDLRFHIVTFVKPGSTFAEGQRVVTLRPGDASWGRDGCDYAYFPNRYLLRGRRHHTLAFSLRLQRGRTRVAHCYPYLYGDLLADVRRLQPKPDYVEVRDLGPTSGGRPLLMFLVTDFSSLPGDASRPSVWISSRVHPGESPASYMMRGVLELLLSKTDEAEALRRRFKFILLPMLNPDGVALGNGRANAAGLDLNRCWEDPPRDSEVAAAKQLLEGFVGGPGGVSAFVDLHAHSRRHGVFTLSNPGSEALPDLFKQACGELFDRAGCSFKYAAGKRGSARCVAWRDFGIDHSHTVESTYAAAPSRSHLVTPQELAELGQNLVRACARLGEKADEAPTGVVPKKRAAAKKKSQGPTFQLVL